MLMDQKKLKPEGEESMGTGHAKGEKLQNNKAAKVGDGPARESKHLSSAASQMHPGALRGSQLIWVPCWSLQLGCLARIFADWGTQKGCLLIQVSCKDFC